MNQSDAFGMKVNQGAVVCAVLCPQVYLSALSALPEVQATQTHPEGKDYDAELVTSYSRYADGSAGSLMARDAKKD